MMRLRIDGRGWMRGAVQMSTLSGKVKRAIAQSAIEGGDKVRTDIRKALRDVTGVKRYSDITQRVFSRSPSPGKYVIVARGPGLPITAFHVRSAGGAVEADPWGVDRIFKRSFFLGGYGRARQTVHHMPIRKLYGPNLAKELVKGNMEERFYASVRKNVGPVLEKRLARALA